MAGQFYQAVHCDYSVDRVKYKKQLKEELITFEYITTGEQQSYGMLSTDILFKSEQKISLHNMVKPTKIADLRRNFMKFTKIALRKVLLVTLRNEVE